MILGLCGVAQAGKDSVANLLVADYGYTKLAFADGVREMAVAIDPYVDVGADRHYTAGNTPFARYTDVLREVGYERAKAAPDVRRLLQRIGTEAVRDVFGPNAWVDRVSDSIYNARMESLKGLGDAVPPRTFAQGHPPLPAPHHPYQWATDRERVVISDVRFPNEADFIRANGGIVVRVLRPGHDNGVSATHASEAQVNTLETDATIEATNMDELVAGVRLFMSGLPGFVAQLAEIRRADEGPEVISAVRVYLAAPWAFKAEAAQAKGYLQAVGVNVISGWTERENTPAEIDATTMAEQARLDRDEVAEADALVILNLAKSDGKASEMGMALAQGKRVILVGERTGNIFYHLPEVERVETLAQAATLLGYDMLEPDGSVVEYRANITQPTEPDITRGQSGFELPNLDPAEPADAEPLRDDEQMGYLAAPRVDEDVQ